MQNWKQLYLELAQKIEVNIPTVEWVDLWHNQVYNLEDEHPFPTPAVFFGFRGNSMKDMGAKIQHVAVQIDVFLFYETFADTYKGGINQTDALAFLDTMDGINKIFHGSTGAEYSSMSRKSFSPVDTGGSKILKTKLFQKNSISIWYFKKIHYFCTPLNWGKNNFLTNIRYKLCQLFNN
jgi:hypothetical protein